MDEIIINNLANKINEKEKSSNKTSSWSGATNNIRYPTEKLVKDSLDAKSDSTHTHNSQISYGQVDDTSTSTVFTATVSGVTALTDGTTVMLKNGVVTSASGFTLNVNNLGAKPVYNNMAAASADTTIFNVNYTMLFVYDSTRISGGCWICYRGYNSDNNTIGYQIRTNSTSFTPLDKTYRYRIMLEVENNKLMPVNTSTSTSATASKTSTMNTREFKLGGNIYYYSYSSAINANAYFGTGYIWIQYNFALGYSFNNTNAALVMTAKEPVYMIAEQTSNGMAKLKTPFFTQTLPNTADGLLYILLGYATSEVNLELTLDHPIYEYRDGGIKLYRDTYTKNETDTLLNGKASSSHTHTTSQITDFPSTMTPSSHTHGNLQNDGSVGTSNNASKNVVTDSNGKITTEAKPTIPTKTSELTNDSGFLTSHQDISGKLDKAQTSYKGKNVVVDSSSGNIAFEDKNNHTHSQYLTSHQSLANYVTNDDSRLSDSRTPTSHTHGNLQNNGQVGSTAQANKNVVTNGSGLITTEDKPTIPSASSITPSADTTSGSVGNGTTWARSNHTHPKSSLYAEASHTHTKSEVTDFPTLHTVATSGSYNDLSDKPNIPEGSTIDTTLSGTSNNAIANSTVKNALDNKLDKTHTSYKGKNVVVDSTTGNITFEDKNNHTHSNYLTSHQDISGKEDKSNKSSSISTDTGSTSKYPSVKAVEDYTHIDVIDTRLQKEEIVYGTIYKTDSSKTYINGTYYKVSSSIPSELILFKLPDDINTSSTKSLCIKISYYYNSHTNPSSLELDVKYNNNIVKENTFLPNTIILLQDATSYFDIVGVFSPNSTGSYNDLTNKPSIPSKTSDLTNDSGFLTSHQDISGKVDKAQTSYKGKNVVVDSSTGNITFEDKNNHTHSQYLTEHQSLSNYVTNSDSRLSDARTPLSHTHGNLQNNGQVGSTAQANKNVVTNSNGLITTEDKPTIPTKTSDLTNDSGFLTSHQDISGKLDKAQTSYKGKNVVVDSSNGNITFEDKNNHTHTNYVNPTIADNLTTDSSSQVLSAKQGKVLNTNKIETSAIATSFASTTSDSKVPSEKLTKNSLDNKLDKKLGSQPEKPLVTGANGYVELGEFGTTSGTFAEGNHTHSQYLTSHQTLDSALNSNSTNAIQNQAVANEFDKLGSIDDLYNKYGELFTIRDVYDTDDLLMMNRKLIYTYGYDKLCYEKTHDADSDELATMGDIPSLSNYVQKSNTSGLLKNDGTVMQSGTFCRYELTSSAYNAAIDTAFTITVKVTDVFGNNVNNKPVTLYHDGTSVSTQNTDSNGTYTWTITPSTWGLHDFNVANTHTQVQVGGWKQIATYLSDRVVLYSDGRNGYIAISGAFSWGTSAGVHDLVTIDTSYLPRGNVTTNYDPQSRTYMPVYLYSNGAVAINKAQTSSSSVTIICTLYYPLATPKY